MWLVRVLYDCLVRCWIDFFFLPWHGAANIKQVLTILSSVVLFNLTITKMNTLGVLLTLIGGAWYARVDLEERGRIKR